MNAVPHRIISPGIFASLGVFAAALAGHASSPTLKGSMINPEHFPRVINNTFAIMTTTYVAVAGMAYYYFGDFVHDVITEDFEKQSPLMHGEPLSWLSKLLQVSCCR